MKPFIFSFSVFLVAVACTHAQQTPALLSEPTDGSASSELEVSAAFRPAAVEETTVHIEGGRAITIQRLALDPGDPVIPVVKPAAPPASDLPLPTLNAPEASVPSYLFLLSATVYPGPLSFLNWTHHFTDGTTCNVSGWSNIDFNHLSGFSSFLATDGQEHSFIMSIGNEADSPATAPSFATTAPTFIPDQQNLPAEALVIVDSLHKLYAIEHHKLAAAHATRVQAEAAQAAELLANPPQPKDLIIRYRIAETPLVPETQTPEQR
jgi:hypothetical protein